MSVDVELHSEYTPTGSSLHAAEPGDGVCSDIDSLQWPSVAAV